MFKFEIGRTVAAIALTVLMSSACVLSAVGPAHVDGGATVASAARLTA